MHDNSMLLFEKYVAPLLSKKNSPSVLEIGVSTHASPFQKRWSNICSRWDTLDLQAREGVDIVATNPYSYPIDDASYDFVIAAQVMEHVPHLIRWGQEMRRVVSNEGYIIVIAPVSWPYHEAPVDCWRVYAEGMNAFLKDIGISNIFSTTDSIEARRYFRTKYGRGRCAQHAFSRVKYAVFRVASLFGFRVEVSMDTIGIGSASQERMQGVGE